jgi:hypothetical protein
MIEANADRTTVEWKICMGVVSHQAFFSPPKVKRFGAIEVVN